MATPIQPLHFFHHSVSASSQYYLSHMAVVAHKNSPSHFSINYARLLSKSLLDACLMYTLACSCRLLSKPDTFKIFVYLPQWQQVDGTWDCSHHGHRARQTSLPEFINANTFLSTLCNSLCSCSMPYVLRHISYNLSLFYMHPLVRYDPFMPRTMFIDSRWEMNQFVWRFDVLFSHLSQKALFVNISAHYFVLLFETFVEASHSYSIQLIALSKRLQDWITSSFILENSVTPIRADLVLSLFENRCFNLRCYINLGIQ